MNTLWIFLSELLCTTLHSIIQPWKPFLREHLRGLSFHRTLWKMLCHTLLLLEEEVGLGSRNSGTMKARGGHPQRHSNHVRWWLAPFVHRGECPANSVLSTIWTYSCPLFPVWTSGVFHDLTLVSWSQALLTFLSALIWGNGIRAEEERIEICLDGASPRVTCGRKGKEDFHDPERSVQLVACPTA